MEELFDEQINENENIDLKRYFRAVKKRWWLVLLITMGIVIPWAIYVKQQPPVFEAEAIISFENIAVTENQIQSRIQNLSSRTFAEEVTAELGLTLSLKQNDDETEEPVRRQDVFTIFSTTKQPTQGLYTLRFYPIGSCALYYESERLDSARVEHFIEDTVSYKEVTFSLNPDIVINKSEVMFEIKNFRKSVEALMAKERINSSRQGDLMTIALRDQNPLLASQMVNSLTKIFIQKSSELSQKGSRFYSNFFKDKLDKVGTDLANIEASLKSFQNKYIRGLDEENRETVDRLTVLETDTAQLSYYKMELEMLLRKLDPGDPDFAADVSPRYIYAQIIRQPAFENDADMGIIINEYSDLDQRREVFLQTRLPRNNPQMVDLLGRIQPIEDKIVQSTQAKIRELESRRVQSVREINQLRTKLGKMPEEQQRFYTLDRNRKTTEEIYTDYLRRYNEALLSEVVVSENVYILDPAIPPEVPVSGSKKKRVIIGSIVGLLFGIGFIIVLEMADKRIKTQKDVRRYINLPLLGIIPKVKFDDYELQDSEKAKSISSQIVTHDYSPTPVGEAYRALRTSLLFSKSVGAIRSLAIGSVSPGEGKSFTATNLAITLAQQKSKTLLIDGDLRRGVLHNTFNCPKKPGLTNYLTGVVPLESVLNETYIPNLTLITCGALIPNPSELLGSVRMKRFIEGITKRFDFVLFDTPPLMAATDAVILGTLVDGIAVLIRSGMTNREDVKRKMELFQNVRANVVGTVLNCAGVEIAHEGYSYYRY